MKKETGDRKIVEIRKFNVLSVGKMFALLGAVAGFIVGILISLMMYQLSNNPVFNQMQGFEQVTTNQLIIVPFWYLIMFGILWGVASILFALVYNLITKKTKGIQLSIR
jgi:hypothetical protein